MTMPTDTPPVDIPDPDVDDPAAPPPSGLGDGGDGGDPDVDPKVKAKIDRANREAAALRARLKEQEPLLAELQKIKDGQKTELEKAQEALAATQAENQRLTVANLRRDAALAAGLDAELVEFLTADTAEELAEQAKRLAKRLKPAEPKRGAPDLHQGQRGTPPPRGVDKNDLVRRMAGFTA